MSKVLITGGAGYVGSVLCGILLDKGHTVRVMDNLHKGNADSLVPYCLNPNFSFFRGDVTHKDELKRAMGDVEYIVHLAAIVGFPDCARAPGLAKVVNIDGTENVLRCKQKGVKLLFASTGSVYGKVEGICTENSPLNAVSLYGLTKIQAENMVLAEEDTVAFRFATGFGVSPSMRVNLLVNDLVYQAVKMKSLTIFQADFRRTFIHVRDMANFL
jgi:nucleoside-diphosphate-sugar epimerase